MFELDPFKKKVQRETGRKGVERDFVSKVSRAGGKAYKFVSENNRGVSDRIVVFPGQVWFVEIKREGGKLTPLQEEFRKYIWSLNLLHFTVVGQEGIKRFLLEVKANDRSGKAEKL